MSARFLSCLLWILVGFCLSMVDCEAESGVISKKRIGVTLHPYYSFVCNIVGDKAEVVPVIADDVNPHNYRPLPDDIKKLTNKKTKLDVLVVNGIGHDEFAFEIIRAARLEGKLPLIYANNGVALIPVSGKSGREKIVNPHTFISITSSLQQVYHIARELGKIDPVNAKEYRTNARKYARRLRKIKAGYIKQLADVDNLDFRCATLHGGYDYLLQEFGLQVTAVIEPKHGIKPTAIELADTVKQIKKHNVSVIFTEMDFPDKVIETIRKETGVKVRNLTHLTGGKYSKDSFEKGMTKNMENLTSALLELSAKRKSENK